MILRARAAVLAMAMNVGTVQPLDLLRLLRVPAIHFVLKRIHNRSARVCRDRAHQRSRRVA
ncbi:MAG TPA: hypothetical protein VNM92_01070 [Thermoanaerobaculia bacterium]|nr:hypothetical protein [Thermoanaerobaculia bacterium]